MERAEAVVEREVVAVEIDKKLIPILENDTLSYYNNVTVINEDVLKLDIVKLTAEHNNSEPIKVVANLPYYITTPIVMGLFESKVPLDSITIMDQKEVCLLYTSDAVPCSAVLCETAGCSYSSGKLFYAASKC